MIRTISLSDSYSSEKNNLTPSVNTDLYKIPIENGTPLSFPNQFNKILAPEIDIFNNLPEEVNDNDHVKVFLDELKKTLLEVDKESFNHVSLPKLRLSEQSDSSTVIEWIFNFFRVYFSFFRDEGDYYGEVINDRANNTFLNKYEKMTLSDYSAIAKKVVSFAIKMAEGGK